MTAGLDCSPACGSLTSCSPEDGSEGPEVLATERSLSGWAEEDVVLSGCSSGVFSAADSGAELLTVPLELLAGVSAFSRLLIVPNE